MAEGGGGGMFGGIIPLISGILMEEDTPGSNQPGLQSGLMGFGNVVDPTGAGPMPLQTLASQPLYQPNLMNVPESLGTRQMAFQTLAHIAAPEATPMPGVPNFGAVPQAQISTPEESSFPAVGGPEEFLKQASAQQTGGDADLQPIPGDMATRRADMDLITAQNAPPAPAGATPGQLPDPLNGGFTGQGIPAQPAPFGTGANAPNVPNRAQVQGMGRVINQQPGLQTQQAARNQAASGGYGSLFPANATPMEKLVLSLDLLGSLYHGRTPAVIAQKAGAAGRGTSASGSGGVSAAAQQAGLPKNIADIMQGTIAVAAHANAAKARVAQYPAEAQEFHREAEINDFAMKFPPNGLPLDHPLVESYAEMMNLPHPVPKIDTIMQSKNPGLAQLQYALTSGDLDKTSELLKDNEVQKNLSRLYVREAEAEGLGRKTGELIDWGRKNNYLEPQGPYNIGEILAANEAAPDNFTLDSDMTYALPRSASTLDTHNVHSDERLEAANTAFDNAFEQEKVKAIAQTDPSMGGLGTQARPKADVWVLPDGSKRRSLDQGRTVLGDDGRPMPIPPNSFPLERASQAGKTAEEFGGIEPIEAQKLRQAEIHVRNFSRLVGEAKKAATSRSLGAGGALSFQVTQMMGHGRSLLESVFGPSKSFYFVDPEDPDNQNKRAYVSHDTFMQKVRDDVEKSGILDRMEHIAMDRGRLKSLIVGLAFSAAAAHGQEGRGASDRDIQMFLQQLGSHAASEAVFEHVLTGLQGDLIAKFEIMNGVMHRASYNPNTGTYSVPLVDVSDLKAQMQGIQDDPDAAATEADPFRSASREDMELLANDPDALRAMSPESRSSYARRAKKLYGDSAPLSPERALATELGQ